MNGFPRAEVVWNSERNKRTCVRVRRRLVGCTKGLPRVSLKFDQRESFSHDRLRIFHHDYTHTRRKDVMASFWPLGGSQTGLTLAIQTDKKHTPQLKCMLPKSSRSVPRTKLVSRPHCRAVDSQGCSLEAAG